MSLWAEGGALRWSAPQGVATAKTIAYLDRHAEVLLDLLAEDVPADGNVGNQGNFRNFGNLRNFQADPVGADPDPAEGETSQTSQTSGLSQSSEEGGSSRETPEDIEAKRIASAAWAREMAEERRLRSGWFGTARCRACCLERNAEIEPCSTCHPPPSLPAGCRARMVCSVLGRCGNSCRDVTLLSEIVADLRLEA
jgi:hypothetical protein